MIKKIISFILVLSIMLSTVVAVSAQSAIAEEYISDLRLVYANTYEEAKQILSEGKFEGYKVLNNNLNAKTGKTGVWLAYKTTTDVDEAITDIAIMQMGGGYNVGNYQELIKKSRTEYEAMGQLYLDAIEYFAEAYEADDFLAQSAYRQLNLYGGLDKYPEDRLGDLFVDGVLKKTDLATLFFEGNTAVTNNIRQLIAMGVSYNEDGKHYLEKVGESAKLQEANPTVFNNKGYNELAGLIATSIPVFRDMFTELSAYEAELNYEDKEVTELEVRYAEYKSFADRMRAVDYLNGKTLYDFCMEYTLDKSDYSSVYPLVDALNEGQVAMTKVLHYYDVIRYSVTDSPEELIDKEIAVLEEKYKDSAVNVYLGVDRSLYTNSFAITNNAYRADAYTGTESLMDALFGKEVLASTALQIASGAVGVGLAVWAIVRSAKGSMAVQDAAEAAAEASGVLKNRARSYAEEFGTGQLERMEELRAFCLHKKPDIANLADDVWNTLGYGEKIDALMDQSERLTSGMWEDLNEINQRYYKNFLQGWDNAADRVKEAASRNYWIGTGVIYFLSAAALAYSAVSIYNKINDHYHPKYDEIPMAMVDLVSTTDGDRYIKYDVVLDAKLKEGSYHAADLNAFAGERWNALYYTKNPEAGKPLLADFEVSDSTNRADKGYNPVHRFGEVVCYDLNKYNFSSDSAMIFLSVRQSENLKSDITAVPDVVGAIFGTSFWIIAGIAGIIVGVGGTLVTNHYLSKKKAEGTATKEETTA